jgi:MFS family permease
MDAETKQEWKDGWPLIFSSTFGISVSSIVVYSMGVFMLPLQREFDWSRAQISSGLLILSGFSITCAPFVGRLIDRVGPRRICLPGLVIFCSAFASLSASNGSIWQWYILWCMIAIGALMLKPTVFTTAVASRFDRARGTALALALSGTGLAGIAAPALSALILNQLGWRLTYISVAAIWFLVVFPICFTFFYGASDLRRKSTLRSDKVDHIAVDGMGAREGLLSLTYIKLALAAFLAMLVIGSMVVHLVPFVTDSGLDPLVASSMASITGAAILVGRLGTGVLLDKFNGAIVGGVAFALPAVLMVGLLNYDGSVGMAIALAILLGFSSGAELDIAAYMTSRHFGMKNYGFFFGIIVGLLALALGIGPTLMSAIFDHYGSYRIAFIGAIPASIAASLFIASIGKYDPRFSPKASTQN